MVGGGGKQKKVEKTVYKRFSKLRKSPVVVIFVAIAVVIITCPVSFTPTKRHRNRIDHTILLKEAKEQMKCRDTYL